MIDELIHELEKLKEQKKQQSRNAATPELRMLIRSELVGFAHAIDVVKDFKKQHRIGN